jgi:hypothetical protein
VQVELLGGEELEVLHGEIRGLLVQLQTRGAEVDRETWWAQVQRGRQGK